MGIREERTQKGKDFVEVMRRKLFLVILALLGMVIVTTAPVFTYGRDEQLTCSHDWSTWHITTKPSCTETGEQEKNCIYCGIIKSEIVPAEGHNWGRWIIDQKATYFKPGKQHHICAKCSEREDKVIPKKETPAGFTKAGANLFAAVTVNNTYIYDYIDTESEKLKKLKFGSRIVLRYTSDKWVQVGNDKYRGYIPKNQVVIYNKKKKHVALTYDDGPNAETTPVVLKALMKNNCRATFFVLGNSIGKETGKLLKAGTSLGCEYGNHSWDHAQLTTLSEEAIASELSKTDELVKKYTGRIAPLCRAPYGAFNDTVLAIMNRPNIFWSKDSLDWKYRDTTNLIAYIKKKVKNGDIVLMHDIHPSTVNATDKICQYLLKKNFELVTVTELAAINGTPLKNGGTYYGFSGEWE